MATPDRSIDPRIFESARCEFLANGFENTSLKAICDGAGITTGALYKRYRSKEDLFCAVVHDTMKDLNNILEQKCTVDTEALSDKELIRAWKMDEAYMLWWFEFLYARRDGFVLLLKCAEGTVYSNFQHDWVEQMTEASWRFWEEACRRGLSSADIPQEELHILLSAFWSTIYEPFIHDFSWEQIMAHCKLVCRLFDWHSTMGFPESQ